jgi:hypothetical protein
LSAGGGGAGAALGTGAVDDGLAVGAALHVGLGTVGEAWG